MKNIQANPYILDVSQPLVMGVVNVTPDSFSDGGIAFELDKAVIHAKQLITDGADIIDIGGESSRPGAEPVSLEEELRRVIPVIQTLRKEGVKIPISIDTYKPEVAQQALEAGTNIINDITGLRDEEMIQVAVKYDCPVIIMHMQGTPQTMQDKPRYENVIEEIIAFFIARTEQARESGIQKIIIDPGIGFGKRLEDNLAILKNIGKFKQAFPDSPILIGTSRKSFINAISPSEPNERLGGTIASSLIAIQNGASIIRVHDVKEMRQAMEVMKAIENNQAKI